MTASDASTAYGANIIGANLRRFYGMPIKGTPYGANIISAAYGANIIGARPRHFYGIKRRIILMVALGK